MERTCLKCGVRNEAASGSELEACPGCGAIYSKVERANAVDAQPRRTRRAARPAAGISQRAIVGLLGAAVLALGVFMPLVSGPMGMQMNYFSNGQGQGSAVLILAACTAVLVLVSRFSLLWLTGGLSAAMVAFTFWRVMSKIDDAKAVMTSGLEDNPFRGLADMAAQSIQMQWGWAVLAIGAVLVLAAAWMKDARVEEED